MSDKPEPALTPLQCASVRPDAISEPRLPHEVVEVLYFETSHLIMAMAVANNDLPDDSPYKITPEDSRFLEQIAVAHAESGEYWQRRTAARLRALALKLAALLPPETL